MKTVSSFVIVALEVPRSELSNTHIVLVGSFHMPNKGVIDLVDPVTGEKRRRYEMNPLIYVNETAKADGSASVVIAHDPSGAAHYMLKGRLSLPQSEEWTELLVDYGEKYEKVRVRNGYSRLPPAEQSRIREELKNSTAETLKDIALWSVREIKDCFEYMRNSIFNGTNRVSVTFAARGLILALRLLQRIQDVTKQIETRSENESFCDNGYSELTEDDVNRCRSVLEMALTSTGETDGQLKVVEEAQRVPPLNAVLVNLFDEAVSASRSNIVDLIRRDGQGYAAFKQRLRDS